jgi:putative protease
MIMKQRPPQKIPELLAPGGDGDCLKAALLAGADAVYCGLPAFNARQRAENIALKDLGALVLLAHQRNCRIYLTLNTLILEKEFDELFELVNKVRAMGIDAVIVQDLGLCFFLKNRFPALEVHASTQMTTHNAGQIAFLSALNVSQVNLSRELSLSEIKALCDFGKNMSVKTEVFVHGAYCISFSGQCYMSSAMSGHSGNRGECVQPCRRAYYVPDQKHTGLPFNLKDNSAFSSAGELIQAGVDSFKIEGRIKNAAYVHTVVTAWREQLERYRFTQQADKDDPRLHTVFNRHFSDGYLKGRIDKNMFIDSSRDQSLVPLSAIMNYHADKKTLTLEKDPGILAQSQVVIYTPDFRFICTGIIEKKFAPKKYLFRIEHELKGKINGGYVLYALGEGGIRDQLKQRIDQLTVVKKPLIIKFRGSEGQTLEATFVSGRNSFIVHSNAMLTKARSVSLTESVIAEKMGMLGNSEFHLESIDCSKVDRGLFLPLKELNELRRKGIAGLTGEKPSISVCSPLPHKKKTDIRPLKPRLACLISSAEDLGLSTVNDVTLLFELPPCIGDRMDSLAGIFNDHPGLIPWFSPILIGEDFTAATTFLDRSRPPLIITDNSGIGLEAAARNIPWIAGPMLNCTNSYALYCLSAHACRGAFISNELSREQIRDIAEIELPGQGTFEAWFSLFNPMLLMNTRQCIIRAIRSCDKKTIDRSCLVNCFRRAMVSDTNNNPFFIEKRAGHYNQVYNGRHYFNLAIVSDIRDFFSTFTVDLRGIPTRTSIRSSKEMLLKHFLAWLHNEPDSGTTLRQLIRTTTAGQYARGL